MRHEHYLVHLFWNPPFCTSTVSWYRRCRIHRYVAAPIIHILADQNKLIENGNKLQNKTWPSVLSGCTFHYINKIIQNVSFKGTVSREILLLVFFHESSFPEPFIIALGSIQICSKIRTLSCEYLRKFSKNLKRSLWDTLGLGENYSWKTWSRKSRDTVPLNINLVKYGPRKVSLWGKNNIWSTEQINVSFPYHLQCALQ